MQYQESVTDLRDDITGSESVPSGAGAGINTTPEGTTRWSEVALYLNAADEADVATVTPWYFDGAEWNKGDGADIVGSTVLLSYTLGGRVDLQLTSITGTYAIKFRLVRKEA